MCKGVKYLHNLLDEKRAIVHLSVGNSSWRRTEAKGKYCYYHCCICCCANCVITCHSVRTWGGGKKRDEVFLFVDGLQSILLHVVFTGGRSWALGFMIVAVDRVVSITNKYCSSLH